MKYVLVMPFFVLLANDAHAALFLVSLGVVADETFVDIRQFAAGSPEDPHTFAVAGKIRVAFDRDEPVIAKVLDDSHMAFPLPCADDKDKTRFEQREVVKNRFGRKSRRASLGRFVPVVYDPRRTDAGILHS